VERVARLKNTACQTGVDQRPKKFPSAPSTGFVEKGNSDVRDCREKRSLKKKVKKG